LEFRTSPKSTVPSSALASASTPLPTAAGSDPRPHLYQYSHHVALYTRI
jgi:hypothetical protein